MYWDILPDDIIKIILRYRKIKTCGNTVCTLIQSIWRTYRTRVLIARFKLFHYLKDFRIWNPNILEFISRSRL